jgi:iron-sulfur cluster repair protein YtfE (RIC family)
MLERIMHEHDSLREKVQGIHAVLVKSGPTTAEIEGLLHEFMSALIAHFSNEEREEGFFVEVTKCAPHLSVQAGDLCNEHKRLLCFVDELCQFASAGSPSMDWWRELSSRCHEFSRQLMQHERQENMLLQQAHQVDFGVGD